MTPGDAPIDPWADLGPTTPSKTEIIRRCRKIVEFATLASERADQGDMTRSLQWLDRARAEATFGDEE